jgi:hypothetical protein
MLRSRGLGWLGLLAVGLTIGAALASTPGVASADSSSDPFSWIGGMDLGDLSVPAQTTALDIQVSIDGFDLFPTAGNTATATSATDLRDIAIAIGNGANAEAFDGFAFADGASSSATAGPGFIFLGSNTAIVIGANSTADAGGTFGSTLGAPGTFCLTLVECVIPGNFDLAAAFGDMLHASAIDTTLLINILPFL